MPENVFGVCTSNGGKSRRSNSQLFIIIHHHHVVPIAVVIRSIIVVININHTFIFRIVAVRRTGSRIEETTSVFQSVTHEADVGAVSVDEGTFRAAPRKLGSTSSIIIILLIIRVLLNRNIFATSGCSVTDVDVFQVRDLISATRTLLTLRTFRGGRETRAFGAQQRERTSSDAIHAVSSCRIAEGNFIIIILVIFVIIVIAIIIFIVVIIVVMIHSLLILTVLLLIVLLRHRMHLRRELRVCWIRGVKGREKLIELISLSKGQ